MKKSVLFLCIAGVMSVSTICKAQQHYYWADDKKNTIEPDSTIVVLMKQNLDEAKQFTALADDKVEQYDDCAVLRSTTKEHRRNLKDQKIDFAVAYRVNSVPLIVTNVVSFKPRASIDEIEGAFKQQIRFRDKTKSGVFHYVVNDFRETLKIANEIAESGLVEWCQPDFLIEIKPTTVDPLYDQQYYLHNMGQTGGVINIDINAPEAWTISTGCHPTRVAVLDQGVEPHEDLGARYLPGFTALNPSGTGLPLSTQYHGQACAGIIAASHNNNLGIAGVSPKSYIIPVNGFTSTNSVSKTADAIRAGWESDRANADVLSNSWSWANAPSLTEITNEINLARTQGRGGKGAIVVFSSGNKGGAVEFPANVAGVITVGAINKSGALWGYSARGPEMELVAPSGNINNSGDVVTLDLEGADGENNENYFDSFGGTSASAPQVAGVAALILSLRPELTETEVRTILTSTATDMGTFGFDNNFGFGRVNAEKALLALFPISGPNLLCTTSTYTLANVPGGSSVTWQATPSYLFSTSSGSGSSASPVRGSGKGLAKLTFTVNAPCGTFKVYRNFWAGPPGASASTLIYPSGQRGVDPVALSPAATYIFQCDQVNGYPTSWTWLLPPGFSFYGAGSTSSSPYITTSATNGSYTLYCHVNNACGSSYTKNLGINIGSGGGGDPLRKRSDPVPGDSVNVADAEIEHHDHPYPNPTTDVFNIDVAEVSILALSGTDGRRKFLTSGVGKMEVPVADLPNGVYFLSISNEKGIKWHKVLVQR